MAERMPDRRSSTLSHQSSVRHSNPDIFSDDFALDSIHISDGFGPSITHNDTSTSPAPTSTRQTSRTVSRRSVALQPSSEQSPNPTKKQVPQGYSRGGSLSSRNDPQMSQLPQRTLSMASVSAMSDATPNQQRPASIISGYSMPRTQSIYRGATGPSHPYGMYPQDTSLNRSSTISSIRPPERSYSGNNGPTHPYGMYPQSVVPEVEVTNSVPLVPVGFPGLDQQYTRRLGPDGEEADDIIGADGHTEQLPPYTRFPDALIAKERYAPDPINGQSSSPQSPLQPVPNSASSDEGSEDERAQINTAAAGAAGLVTGESNTRPRWGRRKACCGNVPRWALITIAVLSILLATLLGAIVGKIIAHRNGSHPSQTSPTPNPNPAQDTNPSIVSTSALPPDATQVTSTPTNLPLLPTGSFELPLLEPMDESSACLPSAQSDAWQCPTGVLIGMNVTAADYGATEVSLYSPGALNNMSYTYGAQPPILNSISSLLLVVDIDDPSNGPAYFFRQMYDKLVILPEAAFPTPSKKRSESEAAERATLADRDESFEDWHRNADPPKPGDQLWVCFWNGTIVEGFIYVTQNSTWNTTTPQELVSSILAAQTQTQSQGSVPTNIPELLLPSAMSDMYPRAVKIEERRALSNTIQPYCQKMQILDNYKLGPVNDASGTSLAIVQLDESETSTNSRDLSKRDVIVSSCSCEWMSN